MQHAALPSIHIEAWHVEICRRHWDRTTHAAACLLSHVLALAPHDGNPPPWFPAPEHQLSHCVGISVRSVRAFVEGFVQLGWLERRIEPAPDGEPTQWLRTCWPALDAAVADAAGLTVAELDDLAPGELDQVLRARAILGDAHL